MKIDSEKLRKRLNKQRDINIRVLDDPFSFNKGIVQSLCILGKMEKEERGMKVMREVKVMADHYEVGDRIKVKLPGAKYTATAIRDDGDGMLFIFDQYLDGAMPMNRNGDTEGGYEASDMRKYLQEVADTFPDKLKKRMVKFENGDFLRLLTLQEMCGKDENFDDCDGQIPWMKQDRRHRIASRKGDEYEWGWLATVVSGADFALVGDNGIALYGSASDSYGVRPAFKIIHP